MHQGSRRICPQFWVGKLRSNVQYLPTNGIESRSTPTHCTPPLSRRLPMRLHYSVTAIKNLRRFPMRCHCHCQGCCAAKLKEIDDTPILLSCHSYWGGCCAVSPLQSCHCQEFKEIANAPPLSLSRTLCCQIEGDWWHADIAVLPLLLRRFPYCSLAAVKNLRRTKDMWEE